MSVNRVTTSSGGAHSFADEEKEAFVEHINGTLGYDEDCARHLPIDPEDMSLFEKCSDGILLCKLINDAVPDTIDERVINKNAKLNVFQVTENNNLMINSAKAIGLSVVNIGSQDIIDGTPHLILGLIWQIIRKGLLSLIDLKHHPELYRLLEDGEEIGDLLKLPPEQILLRWFNYHLKNAGWERRVKNFSGDIKDGENYTVLLNQLAPKKCSKDPLNLNVDDRAEAVLVNADKLGCRKYVTARDILKGNPKLNLAFVANLFNTCPGLEELSEEELSSLEDWLFDSAGSREARAFCLWINSLGVEPFVANLFDDLRNGLVLLRVFDKISPGCVDWRRVNQKVPMNKFKKVENCNYAVNIGKELGFSLVGVAGSDIMDGNETLTLALVWQMMRFHVISVLESLSQDGNKITDNDMINWANQTAASSGSNRTINGFKDPSLSTSLFLLDLLEGVRSGTVDQSLVTPGETDEDATQNARYAISIARKLGATIFCLPEDIIEVKNKMILTFIGSLMAASKSM
eukprot:TRINITY_DN15041_c0_g1_i1.p1 TRINITY_DN15041_c0_g1~~TRINITY_DN15041_c0_g1_i1.p1  ORF type:complete len:518 (-),score=223.23 TRINITY_DN15041_c0_g1_i1:166-1719(-)